MQFLVERYTARVVDKGYISAEEINYRKTVEKTKHKLSRTSHCI